MKKIVALLLSLVLVCSTASALADYQSYTSKTLALWCNAFNYYATALAQNDSLSGAVDLPVAGGSIIYNESSYTYGYSGVGVIHGGAYSPNNTVTLGVGTGLDDQENYWYASLTYSAEASSATNQVAGFAFMLACVETGLPLDKNSSDFFSTMGLILDTLWSSDNMAIQMGDLVLVHKMISGNRHLLAVDSLAYYDEFYYNDTENYIVLD